MKIVRNLLIGVLLLGGAVCGFAQGIVVYTNNPVITHAMKNQGTYASGTTYAANDVVISSGVSYLSLSAGNVGHTPASSPTFWQPLGAASSLVLGTTSGTAAEGNDSRIVGAQQAAAKGAASGYAGLDSSSHLLAVNEPAHTGDVTSPAGSTVNTLATVNSNVGSCGDATHVGQVTLDAKGRATGCAQVAITAASDFVGSGTGHAHGLVPDPGASAGTTKYLREDGTWVIPTSTTGLGDPGANGLVKRTALGVTAPATAADVQDALSTDTVNNSSTAYSAGSGGDSTVPLPTSGKCILAYKGSTLQKSCNGDSYSNAFPLSCQPGIGDGLNLIPSGTYPQTTCKNDTGTTWVLSGIKCFADTGTSTCNVAKCLVTDTTTCSAIPLLTGAITGTPAYAAGTQSSTVTVAPGDFLKITFVSDGTTKQVGVDISGRY